MVVEKRIVPRPISSDRLLQLAEERRQIDYEGSIMFEDILKRKGIEYHRDSTGMFKQGAPGEHDLIKVTSVDSLGATACL